VARRRAIGPEWLAAGILCGVVLVLRRLALGATQQHFGYALDDPYIHIAMARNLMRDGTWGVNPHEFVAASSSPLWTLLVAGLAALGVDAVLAPFVLAWAAAVGLVFVAARVLRAHGLGPGAILVVLLVLVFVVPLAPLVFAGMEHPLHALLVVAFLESSVRAVQSPTPGARLPWPAIGLAAALTATRYESVAVIGAVALWFVLHRRWRWSAVLALAAAVPPFVYGWASLRHGGSILPNALWVKGTSGLHGRSSPMHFIEQCMSQRNLALTALLAVLAFWLVRQLRRTGWRDATSAWLAIALGIAIAHVQFAALGWFFRYEAYLFVVGSVAVALAIAAAPRRTAGAAVTVALLAVPFGLRAVASHRAVPTAVRNIYEQQIQMARFLHTYYTGQPVAMNDVGAVSVFSDIHCIDVVGIADADVLQLRRAHRLADLDGLVRHKGAHIAVVYESWFGRWLPDWHRTGTWTIHDNIVCGDSTVTFLAADPAADSLLTLQLHAFESGLPAGVRHEVTGPRAEMRP
jgi:hypothetical protein